MKKLGTLLISSFVTIGAMAANFNVTVQTQEYITYKDVNSHEIVAESTNPGQTLTFEVTADTPDEAEDKAKSQCSTTCNLRETCVAENVSIKGHKCNKFKRIVVHSARATKKNY